MKDRNLTQFDILPAIDVRAGCVVRLVRGDFARETVYADDPVAIARGFVEQGAGWLHVVDLDGARDPAARQVDAIAAIVAAVGDRARVEVAGGLRDVGAVATILEAGARRAVLGTAVLQDPDLAGLLVAAHGPERIAVALDVRDGLAVGQGWLAGASGVPVEKALTRLADVGVTTFEVTAIDRDGTLAGPDIDLLTRLLEADRGAIIASAGIASLDDLDAVRALGCAGVIVGRAIYDGSMDLAAALEVTSS